MDDSNIITNEKFFLTSVDICRVCRSPSSPTQALFHPCKCSGSMKYIHQSCLEQWLKHSGKRSCDICNYIYAFIPIYSPDSPERIGIIAAFIIIASRILKKMRLYSRIAIASLCWLVWVPYVTAWTWRLFMNPASVLEEQAVVSYVVREPKFTRFISSIFGIPPNALFVVKVVEMSADWPAVIKSFFSDVFEGQIICAVVMMIILVLFLIREYILANEQAPIVLAANIGPIFAPPAQLPELVVPDQVLNELLDDNHELAGSPLSLEKIQIEQEMEPISSNNVQYNFRARSKKGKEVEVEPEVASSYFSKKGKEVGVEDEVAHTSSSSKKYPGLSSYKDKVKLVLDQELEAELNASSPLLDYSLEPLPSITSEDEIARHLQDLRDNERNLENIADANIPAAQEVLENELVEEPALNMAVNVGIADGEIVAQIEVNDMDDFLNLVGMRGRFTMLLQSISLAHLTIMLILGIGIWIPYLIGSFSTHLLIKILVPSVEVSLNRLIISIQRVSDPLVEPIADRILSVFNSTKPAFNFSMTPSFSSLSGADSDLEEVNIPFGPYHANFFQSFKEDLFVVFIGYSVLVASILLYSSRVVGRVQNPYFQVITRFAQSISAHLSSAIKIIIFVVLELACFPLYCGILINLCTLPVLSSQSTIATRFALFYSYPWLFCFLHWIIGSTFMFQLAIYVAFIREMFRPGVLWFLKDPNDPNFNAMRELLRKSIFYLIRKLLTGAVLYGTIIIGVVGGGIQLVLLADLVSVQLTGPVTIFKVFPLRLEYYDSLSEIPFDLFFFHCILPHAIRFMKPEVKFRKFILNWFSWSASALRITHFLLGKPKREEESDFEDEEGPHTADISLQVSESIVREGSNVLHNLFEKMEEVADDVQVPPILSPSSFKTKKISDRKREMRYMRVPNLDSIKIVPKYKMLVLMREEDPVFGRPEETEDEIKVNWTKVYVPQHFYSRIWVLVLLHMATFICLVPLVFALPIVCGRLFFVYVQWYLVEHISVPLEFNFSNPVLSHRKDLPTHDLYSFFAGICVLYLFQICYRFFLGLQKLRRRNAIRRSPTGVNAPLVPSAAERFRVFWHRKGRMLTLIVLKFLFLFCVVGLILPLILGIIFNIYIVNPIQGTLRKTPIVFFILDWSTGAMAMRIAFNILAMAPERRITRLINQANAAGLARMNVMELVKEIFLPIMLACVPLLATPFVAQIIDFHFDLPSNFFNRLVTQNGAIAFLSLYIGSNVFSNTFVQIRDWFDHLKDDQYMVGRTLQNIE